MWLSILNMRCHRKIKDNNHSLNLFPGERDVLKMTQQVSGNWRIGIHRLWLSIRPFCITSPTLRWQRPLDVTISPHLLLPEDWWVLTETTSFTAAYCEYPLKFIQLPLSQRTQSSSIFLIYPHDSLPAQQVYTICRCGKGGRKSLTIYNQSSSPALFLKPCLHLFLQSLVYAVPSILLNLWKMGDNHTYLIGPLRIKMS